MEASSIKIPDLMIDPRLVDPVLECPDYDL